MKNRAGEFRKNLADELQYKSFLPSPVPPKPPIEIDEEIESLLAKTNRTIGILEELSRQVPINGIFVPM